MFKSIRSRLALSFAAIALVAAVVLGAVLLVILQNYYLHLEFDYLRGNARFVGGMVMAMTSDKASHDEVQSQIENLAFLTQTRIQVFDTNQQSLYDSRSPQEVDVSLGSMKQLVGTQANGNGAPSMVRVIAINMNPGTKISLPASVISDTKDIVFYRSVQASGSPFGFDLSAETLNGGPRSPTRLKQKLMDPESGTLIGTVELSDGPALGRDILNSVAVGWGIASVIAVTLAAGIGWFISRRISAPVLALTDVTARMAAGDLSSRADVGNQDELGLLAHSFNEMADRVEGTVVTLRRFVSDAAHELNSPLTVLRTDLDLAVDENNAAEQNLFIERAQTMVARLQTLTNDLLDLSRIETKTEKEPPLLTDLSALLNASAEVYASQAEQAGLTLTVKAPHAPIMIYADPGKVQRALNNLMDNACKFTPAGGTVAINLRRENEQALLSIADSGIGIPADDLPQLFNRFHRGRNATAYPGSGLGLAIVKAIVEQQGGRITAENCSPGARFSLEWPYIE